MTFISDPPTTGLPKVEIVITVTEFRNLLDQRSESGISVHRMSLPDDQSPVVTLDEDKLYVRRPGAVLQFTIQAKDPALCLCPLGIGFADHSWSPKAVFWGAGNQTGRYTPFTDLRLNGPVLEITDDVPRPIASSKPQTFKFSIFIQDRESGGIGLIDPFIENENSYAT